ncbi:N-acetyltransferase, GNAT-family [Desulfotignum phosphitoxidans DSM 13687]|uniref:N-acetyltransferase, GNAT-family n=1 Tax=Desulfotignum phosphitoxidans DSM 13687 TaxID=1286635 RepID=S0G2C3_9BACT|nr:N-acetyltransferase, GNAT-family [Desulfotignum phosphitoxidans DSM 13687]
MIPTLKTKRLTLRPLSKSDQSAMVDAIMSDMDVMRWLPYSDAVSTFEGQQEVALGYINDFIKPWDTLGFGVWAICIGDTELGPVGTFIGYCGFLPEQIEGSGPEIAYAMRKSMWTKGLVTEALTACLDWIFIKPEIHFVHAVTDRENFASRRVMEKIGMRHEKDVDLYGSVAKGNGLLPFYYIDREVYIRNRPD